MDALGITGLVVGVLAITILLVVGLIFIIRRLKNGPKEKKEAEPVKKVVAPVKEKKEVISEEKKQEIRVSKQKQKIIDLSNTGIEMSKSAHVNSVENGTMAVGIAYDSKSKIYMFGPKEYILNAGDVVKVKDATDITRTVVVVIPNTLVADEDLVKPFKEIEEVVYQVKKTNVEEIERAKREAEENARREVEEAARREAEEKARQEAEEKARQEAEEAAKREAEEKARQEAEEAAKREAEEKARQEAEEAAKREAEEKARQEAEEAAKREAEEKARQEAEEAAKQEEAPAEEAKPEPAEEAPVEETQPEPVEEAPVEEAKPEPAEEAPTEEAKPEPTEEAPVEEATEDEEDDDEADDEEESEESNDDTKEASEAPASAKDTVVEFDNESKKYKVTKIKKTYECKLCMLEDDVKGFYSDVKNALLSYGLVLKATKTGEKFRIKKNYYAQLKIVGKQVGLFLALDPKEYEDSKYKGKDLTEKKAYAQTPFQYKFKTQRKAKWALELVDALALKNNLVKVEDYKDVDFKKNYPTLTEEELIEKGYMTKTVVITDVAPKGFVKVEEVKE